MRQQPVLREGDLLVAGLVHGKSPGLDNRNAIVDQRTDLTTHRSMLASNRTVLAWCRTPFGTTHWRSASGQSLRFLRFIRQSSGQEERSSGRPLVLRSGESLLRFSPS